MTACVVTAFYKIPSKSPVEQYLKWIEPFFREMPCSMVIFTEGEFVDLFKKYREKWMDRTIVVNQPLCEFTAFKKWKFAWYDAIQKDEEIATGTNHTAQLYAIWYEKKEFVLKAIQMKAFGADQFVWCDAGILRFPEWLPHLQKFPMNEYIPAGRMTLLSLAPFQPEDTVDTVFQHTNRVGGGIQAADADTWQWWSIQYDSMMVKYQLSNRFIGKDQSIMASLCVAHPDRVNLVSADLRLDGYTKWFWLLLYLGGVTIS